MSNEPETAAIFDHLWDTRVARVDQQLERIANTAYWLGRKLAKHEITKQDVDRRIDALCTSRNVDDDTWVPWDIARDHAEAALRRGINT